MDAAQFHSSYDAFPEALLLCDGEGRWMQNPAAERLELSQSDLDQLALWNGSSSVWLAGRFHDITGHRTADGLFLILHADAFLSGAALSLSAQLRQRLQIAFHGLASLNRHLNDPAAAKENLSSVNHALYQILRMTTELDRCADEELPCHKICLDLTQWLQHLGEELKHWCAEAVDGSIQIDTPSASMFTMADPDQLDYMVAHLVSNALKAASDGEAKLFLSLKQQDSQAVLTIRGNGDAFSPTLLADPLWNDPTQLSLGRGLGLGIPIAKRIAALHGGTIVVAPVKDGSQVAVSLPLYVPEGYLASPAPRVEPYGGFSKVRIVLSDALPPAAFHPDYPDFN